MAIGWIEQKRRYRQYKARTKQLPANYHTAIDALERYLTFFGPTKGDSLLSMLEDLADLFDRGSVRRALLPRDRRGRPCRVRRGVSTELPGGSVDQPVVKILSTLLKADAGTASVNGFDVATEAADVRESISLTR